MLNFFRHHKKIIMYVLILIMIPGLSFISINSFFGSINKDKTIVASVNKRKITHSDYINAINNNINYARNFLGKQFNIRMFDNPVNRYRILNALIEQQIISDETDNLSFRSSDESVYQEILKNLNKSLLKKSDGSIDFKKYKLFLLSNKLTPNQYDNYIRDILSSKELIDSIKKTSIISEKFTKKLIKSSEKKFKVQKILFHSKNYAKKININNSKILSYYNNNLNKFKIPDTININYLIFSPLTISTNLNPKYKDLKKYYNDNLSKFQIKKNVCIRQILILSSKEDSLVNRSKKKDKAKELLKIVSSNPEKFSQIAKENSQDNSKRKDIQCLYIGTSAGGHKFDDVVFNLKKNQISSIIETDIGYHIVQVVNIKPARTKSFKDEYKSILQEVREILSKKLFEHELKNNLLNSSKNIESIKYFFDKYKIKIKSTKITEKQNLNLSLDDPLNNKKFLKTMFLDKEKNNTNNIKVIHISKDVLIICSIKKYIPSFFQKYDEVKDIIKQMIISKESYALAKIYAKKILIELKKTKSTLGFSKPFIISHKSQPKIMQDILNSINTYNNKKFPIYIPIDFNKNSCGIYRINSIIEKENINKEEIKTINQKLSNIYGKIQVQKYINSLKSRANIKLFNKNN